MLRPTLILAMLSLGTIASAQTPTPFVAIHDLTVEDRDPPDYLRQTLDDNTRGVMRDFDVCYAQRQALRANLAGAIQLRLWVSAQQVIRVTPESNTVGDDELLACVKTRLLALRLPSDSPRAGATVRFTLRFTAPAAGNLVRCVDRVCSSVPCGLEGAPCCPSHACSATTLTCNAESVCVTPPPPPPPPPAPTVSIAVSRVTGVITAEEVPALLPTAAIEACVTEATTRDGIFTITATRTGRVTVATNRSMRPTAVSTCVRNALRTVSPGTRARTSTVRLAIARLPAS